jgi:hypothetical protein
MQQYMNQNLGKNLDNFCVEKVVKDDNKRYKSRYLNEK